MADACLTRYLECGRIINTHGCRGGLKAEPWADDPADLCRLKRLFLRRGDQMLPLSVRRVSVMKGQYLLLEVDEVTDMDSAAALRGEVLYVLRDDMPLRKGQYFLADAEGMPVRDGRPGKEGRILGRVAEIVPGVAAPILSVDTGHGHVLVPAVAAFVREVVPGSHVTLTPISGMFDGEAEMADDAATETENSPSDAGSEG